ncbi:MAG: 30S ribosomal protein S8 [Candidatus Absconditabacterales bacterium]
MTYINAPIHDLLIRIKNAYMARKTSVEDVPFSNFKVQILELLKQYRFVQKFDIKEEGVKKFINITLKRVIDPVNDVPNIKFFSKPSRPWYVSYKNITLVAGGKGIGIISTNQGLMPSHVAKEKKLGGELIAEIY